MGLFDFFKNLLKYTFDEKGNDYLNFQNAKKCMIKVKLPRSEMSIWALDYIRGITSYRQFVRDVFKNDLNRFKEEITKNIENRAKKGCYYDEVYFRFYADRDFYIDIPLNVFSQKNSLVKSELNKKLWHKNNLIRLMKYSNYFKEKIIEYN